MNIHLNHCTPLQICSDSIRQCWQSQDKSDNGGPVDLALIDRIGNKFKHSSTLEHLVYNFSITGISRACLQELARHRLASLSVKSTRYTLKELKNEKPFSNVTLYGENATKDGTPWRESEDVIRASKYLVLTGNNFVDSASVSALEQLRGLLYVGISNDIAKYCLPEAYKTSLSWTINARSLQNFLSLRSDKAALWEIRNLATEIYSQIPEEHKYLFSDAMKELSHAD